MYNILWILERTHGPQKSALRALVENPWFEQFKFLEHAYANQLESINDADRIRRA